MGKLLKAAFFRIAAALIAAVVLPLLLLTMWLSDALVRSEAHSSGGRNR